jgi:hypothetical protein
MVVVALWPLHARQGLATAALALGTGLFALGIVLGRVKEFTLSLKGLTATLEDLHEDAKQLSQSLAAFQAEAFQGGAFQTAAPEAEGESKT